MTTSHRTLPPQRSSPPVVFPQTRSTLLAQLEAILFQATEPMSPAKLADALHHSSESVVAAIRQLQSMYLEDDSGFTLDPIAGGYLLRTGPETTPWLVRLKRIPKFHALPANLLETLSIIADRQPVTRADVEAVRGVACAEVVKLLLSMGLIRTAGRHASLGRPQLYATTKRFLQTFGMNSLAELPREPAAD
jgi:segregation and condensation protein B